ncbi:MAG: efflux RND transporter periplasmic adaptor subunit [Verrucomicrobia bacterium]|nr:efflux RND transporter periplasmic adaptor subunit [Verrucomicrobiota bacterium]
MSLFPISRFCRAPLFLLALQLCSAPLAAGEMTPEKQARLSRTIILDETSVKNLRLETVEAEETTFESTVFALGRVEAQPHRRAVVASRVPGRILEFKARVGDRVAAGAEVARLETRQPGDPPPAIALRAPLAGEVTSVELRLGEPVEPDRVVMEIMDLAEVQVVARVPEHFAAQLALGAKARIHFPGRGENLLEGKLQRLASTAERESGTVEAVILVPNQDGHHRPGQRAEVHLVRSARPDVRVVPRAALQGEGAQRFVYVKDYELKYAYVRTPVGEQNDRYVEIVEGLLPGDEVVTRGAYALVSAGRGSVSLKAALDAAHGHEHNEDGTEMTAEQRAAREAASRGAQPAAGPWQVNRLSALLAGSCVLLVVLWLGALRRPSPASATRA